jgi:pilus assembly protein Flp/PilA
MAASRVHRAVAPSHFSNDLKESAMNGMFSKLRQFVVSEDGPTAVEYAVMLAMIITACVTVVKNLGTTVSASFSSASSALGGGGS